MTDIKFLIRQKANVKGQLTKFQNAVAELPETVSVNYLQSRHVRLLELWAKYENVFEQLETAYVNDVAATNALIQDRDDFESVYFTVDELYRNELARLSDTNLNPDLQRTVFHTSADQSVRGANDLFDVRLPKVEIPTFSGRFEDWLPFWDVFDSLIKSNPRLPNVQKFCYLKSCVKGEPHDLIKNLATTDANFDQACQMLQQRYDHKRTIVNAHFAQLLEFERLKSETATGLRQLINNYEKNLASLRAMHYEIGNWDELLVYIVQDKLPIQTRKQWELSLADLDSYPSFDLLYNGSQSSFITSRLVRRLQLRTQSIDMLVDGIGSSSKRVSKFVELEFSSVYHSDHSYRVRALVLPTITDCLPSSSFDKSQYLHLDNLTLADPSFNIASPVDLLLSSDIFLDILKPGKIEAIDGSLVAINSTLGWLIGGRIAGPIPGKVQSLFTIADPLELELNIRKFWEIEDISFPITEWTTEEKECEQLFVNTLDRSSDGRFIVKLPFCKPSLSNTNYSYALNRLSWLERKFENNCEFGLEYRKFIKECIDLGHLIRSPDQTINGYYLPHHGVIKQSSTTTKLRVVFDGSSVSSCKPSLNSVLHTGPKLQSNMLDILLRFRTHKIGFVCDLEKMYRQILVADDDQKFQKILFRSDKSDPIMTYQLTTVVYGLRCSPFLAVRCLRELAKENLLSHPLAANVLLNDTYIDDIVSGADSIEDALTIQSELVSLLNSAGFHARKWSSNSVELLKRLPEHDLNCSSYAELFSHPETSLLGLLWLPNSDEFRFKVNVDISSSCTKRTVLSQIAKLFDPYGWIGPIVVFGKIFLQRLWLNKNSWDEELPDEIRSEWFKFRNELSLINDIKISRFVGDLKQCEIYAFCDASTRAYGCCVYVKYNDACKLLVAKSKVAPLKPISLPRLELLGLALLVKLLKATLPVLGLSTSCVSVWLDSTIVLAWLSKPARNWSIFVRNRIAEIQDYLQPSQFRHVRSKNNPADLISRGCYPSQFINDVQWWTGPNLSSLFDDNIRQNSIFETDLEVRKDSITVLLSTESIFNQFSNLFTLVRVTAYIFRFVNACKKIKIAGCLSVIELENARLKLCKFDQLSSFPREYDLLKSRKPVLKGSKLASLNPFVDESGVIRVNSRLANSFLSKDRKFPIVLDHQSKLALLIVRSIHLQYLHSGINLTCSIVRSRYWIISLKSLVRRIVRGCVVCQRHRAQSVPQLMASLPNFRTTVNPPFTHCGLDFCGPFQIVARRTRGKPIVSPAYCCVFVCLTTKAVHLELLSDLSLPTFMATFRRFSCRRRVPSHLYSDNAKTFVASKKYISQLIEFIHLHKSQISTQLSNMNVSWHFIPPYTPHMGGMWEACVKSLKYHLKRVVGTMKLTFEEFTTVLTQIECCLNSRPLTPFSTDLDDLDVLTPNHFLNGDYAVSLPELENSSGASTLRRRWHCLQTIIKSVWLHWKASYLHQLSLRNKWRKTGVSLVVGDLVIAVDKCSPPAVWHLGRILKVYPGHDGISRVVDVKIDNKIKRKSSANLIKLFFD